MIFWLLAACKHDGEPADGTGTSDPIPTTTTTADLLPPASVLLLVDATDIAWTATVTAPQSALQPGGDFLVDWSGVTHDLLGAPFEPGAVKSVQLTAVTLEVDEILADLGQGGLPQPAIEGRWQAQPAGGSARASTFRDPAGDHAAFDPAAWVTADHRLVAILTDVDGGWISAVLATADGADDHLVFGEATADWSLTRSPTVLSTTTGMGPWSFDWSALVHSANGLTFHPNDADQVWIARLPGPPDADNAFALEPRTSADEFYLAPAHTYTSLDSADLLSADGINFAGFTEPATWFVGLACSDCPLPVPYYVGQLRVIAP